jgi:hypothetical protein
VKTIELQSIVEALEFQSDEGAVFFDRETGEVHAVGPDELGAAEPEDDIADYPEWQRPLVELARQIFSDSTGRFVELPDRSEVHEYRALEDFASSQPDPDVASQLQSAITGRGAFSRFKDAVHRLGLADSWYSYREKFLLEIASDWCEANGIPFIKTTT